MKRLMIVADHMLVAQTIRLALRQTAGFEVIGFLNGRVALGPEVAGMRPDVIVVDEMHDPREALRRLAELRQQVPGALRLLLTVRMDPDAQDEAFAAGADAVISKTVHPVSLATLLKEVTSCNVVSRARRGGRRRTGDCPLTERELEILQLVAQGFTNGRIARELWVTEQTVKFHLSNTYRKLGVANRTEASRYAHTHDLLAA